MTNPLWNRTALLVCALSVASSQAALAQPPELDSVSPRGAQRGAEVTIAFQGERLDEVTDVLFVHDGMTLVSFDAKRSDEATATIACAADCPLGEHAFWLVGPGGLSEAATLSIGRFAVSEEREPNDLLADAEPRSLGEADGVTIRGLIESADVDAFRFSLRAGERLSAEVEATRLGGALIDTHLEIVGPDGGVIAERDDSPLTRQDPHVSVVATTAGNYTVRVREAAFGGDYESMYRLHVGRFARPLVAYPAGGPPGATIDATLIGDGRGDLSTRIDLPATPDVTFSYAPDDGVGGPPPTPLRLRVAAAPNVLEAEPNNDGASATEATRGPVALNGVLQAPGDEDCFAFDAAPGDRLDVSVYAARIGSPVDSVVTIEGPDGRVVVSNDDGIVHDSAFVFHAARAGRHVLRIRDHLGRGGPEFVYRVEMLRPGPGLDLTLPTLDRLRPRRGKAIAVPRGGRAAVLVSARRSGFDGALSIEAGPLPSGVRVSAPPVPVGEHLALLLFEAAETAPAGAGMIDVAGFGEANAGVVAGVLNQEIGLVFGEPRRTAYYSVTLPRTPLVVTEPAPFTLRVDPPTARLAQDGIKELRVYADRAGGFNGPITIDAPQLPEWVERSEDAVVIPAGESEGVFPLIAGDRAEPGLRSLVLIGAARVDGANVANATGRIDVRVDRPYASVTMESVATEQGRTARIPCEITWVERPSGAGVATLRGLPKHAIAQPVRVGPTDTEFVFDVSVGTETPASLHNTLFVELAVPEAGEVVRQYVGRTGTLEVFERGGSARETRSRLTVLREGAMPPKLTSRDD